MPSIFPRFGVRISKVFRGLKLSLSDICARRCIKQISLYPCVQGPFTYWAYSDKH